MSTWQWVRDLRKSGQAAQALQAAKDALAQSPDDYQMRSQAEWACFDLIKGVVARIQRSIEANARPQSDDLDGLYEPVRAYTKLKPKIPDMAASNILYQLAKAKVGRHFEPFLRFLMWCGSGCLRPQDFDPNPYEGHVFSSWAMTLAREAAAWVKRRPDATSDQLAFAIGMARDVHKQAKDLDKTWLEWDLAVLMRRAGTRRAAAELIVGILKRKRTEFWAWAEAARIHRDEQPDLAIACFCQALRLNAEARFLGKVHCELAELLADAANPSQATREAMITVEIYDQQGWKYPAEVQALLQSDWYDPSLVAEEPSQFYSQHAEGALALCFDEVRKYSATYLGMTEGREGKKPKPRFAVCTGDGVASILGRRGASVLETRHTGSPVNLLIGIEGPRRDVLEVLPRPDGSEWDCMETREGVISLRPANGDSIIVYCDRDREMRVAGPSARKAMDLGAGVRVWGVTNPASGRFEVHKIESTAVPQHADIGLFTGRLSRTNKGFGFVGDVFVPAPLVELVPQDALDCAVVAVMKFDKTKQRYSWRAVAISSCHCSKTGNC